jgi:hypothetical protein
VLRGSSPSCCLRSSSRPATGGAWRPSCLRSWESKSPSLTACRARCRRRAGWVRWGWRVHRLGRPLWRRGVSRAGCRCAGRVSRVAGAAGGVPAMPQHLLSVLSFFTSSIFSLFSSSSHRRRAGHAGRGLPPPQGRPGPGSKVRAVLARNATLLEWLGCTVGCRNAHACRVQRGFFGAVRAATRRIPAQPGRTNTNRRNPTVATQPSRRYGPYWRRQYVYVAATMPSVTYSDVGQVGKGSDVDPSRAGAGQANVGQVG